MSGHSKWSNIKHRKEAVDAKKGVLFTRLAREIAVAAREGGGGDSASNYRLRLAVDKAKQGNMPTDNIDRAIKKGLGVAENGARFEEALYEGYGPGGAAILLQVFTDNRNRTASEVRTLFSRNGGNLVEAGSVAWIFESKALVSVEGVDDAQAEEIALAAIDASAEDFKVEDGVLEVTGPPSGLEAISQAVRDHGATPDSATVTMLPKTTLAMDAGAATQVLRLLDRLEELDDVQGVFTNADFPDEALAEYQNA